jgi:AhpD family alkylhydroperoxidase
MPHLEKLPIEDYSWISRIIFAAQKWKYGAILEPAWAWGRSMPLLLAMQIYYRLLDRKNSPLSRELRALISNRISQLNHCEFCLDISAGNLLKQGVSEDKLFQVSNYESSSLFTEKEKAALKFADLVTTAHRIVSKEEFQRLKPFFTEKEIVELTAWISFQNLSSKFNAALDISPQGFCNINKK